MIVTCEYCHNTFNKKPADIKRTKSNFCDRQCRAYWYSDESKNNNLKRYNVTEQGCWEWSGPVNVNGYGVVKVKKNTVLAHRLFYESMVCSIGEGLFACHHCDNPACVNPDHIFLGTHKDNMKDMVLKGRNTSKLKSEDINLIRLSEETVTTLARRFGVTERTIKSVKEVQSWKHVPLPPTEEKV